MAAGSPRMPPCGGRPGGGGRGVPGIGGVRRLVGLRRLGRVVVFGARRPGRVAGSWGVAGSRRVAGLWRVGRPRRVGGPGGVARLGRARRPLGAGFDSRISPDAAAARDADAGVSRPRWMAGRAGGQGWPTRVAAGERWQAPRRHTSAVSTIRPITRTPRTSSRRPPDHRPAPPLAPLPGVCAPARKARREARWASAEG
jgi:hypothetical protein